MAEVNNQLAPLKTTVEKLAGKVEILTSNGERLYNSNGGPPGFLQWARAEDEKRQAEDKRTFQKVFEALEEHKEDMKPLKNFVYAHEIMDQDREKERKLMEEDRKREEEKKEKERAAVAEDLASKVAASERRFDHKVKIIGIAVAVFGVLLTTITVVFGFWNHH